MNIIKNSNLWFRLSLLLIALAVGALAGNAFVRGQLMNFGIDFTGGSLLNLRFEKPVDIGQVRLVLDDFQIGESIIQKSGDTDLLIRTVPLEVETRQKIMAEIKEMKKENQIKPRPKWHLIDFSEIWKSPVSNRIRQPCFYRSKVRSPMFRSRQLTIGRRCCG